PDRFGAVGTESLSRFESGSTCQGLAWGEPYRWTGLRGPVLCSLARSPRSFARFARSLARQIPSHLLRRGDESTSVTQVGGRANRRNPMTCENVIRCLCLCDEGHKVGESARHAPVVHV